jgi:hypothetical protein
MTCTKCGKRVAPGVSACESCGAPVDFSAADRERMKVDINARVMWGDPVEDIRTDWLAKGAPPDAVRDELEAAYAARQLHFRKRGMQDLLMGVSALILGGAGVSWSYFGLRGSVRMTSGEFKLSILMICLLFVGGFLLIRGIHRILTGGAAEKSASDLSEID